MTQRVKVGIKDLRLYGHHGIHEEETIKGTWFAIDCELEFEHIREGEGFTLNETIDYEKVADICKDCMEPTTHLIETVAQRILDKGRTVFPQISRMTVSVKKINPPLKYEVDYCYVSLDFEKSI